MKRSRGFTLIELLVVVAIIGLLVSMLIPTLSKAREITKQTVCGSNLNGIGKALALYQSEAKELYPILYQYTAYPTPNASGDPGTFRMTNTEPFSWTTEPANAAAASNLWGNAHQQSLSLLSARGYTGDRTFLCPSNSEDGPVDRSSTSTTGSRYGFANAKNCSYGIQTFWDATQYKILVDGLEGDVAIIADRALYNGNNVVYQDRFQNKPSNSGNHRQLGQNVLFAAYNVRFEEDPKCGSNRNMIYAAESWNSSNNTWGGPQAPRWPNDKKDSVIISVRP